MTKCESRFDTQYKRQDSLPGELKAHKAVQSGTGDMQESAANGVNGVVAQWFNGKGIEAPDDFWLAYLAETLADGDSVDLEQISELLSSCSSELAGEAATVAALSLVEQVQAFHQQEKQQQHAQPAQVGASDADRMAGGQSQAPQPGGQQQQPSIEGNKSAGCSSTQSDSSGGSPSACQAEIEQLQEMCPALGTEFAHHIITTCGSLEAAIEYVLEDLGENVREREAAWLAAQEAAAKQAQQEAQLARKAKQAIVEKFGLRPVPLVPAGTKPSSKKQELAMWSEQGAGQAPKVRYRDGQAVSFRGEKFIVEKTGEDWDGGSRGKVYTKGKRGKGFV